MRTERREHLELPMKCFSFLKSYHIKVRFSVVAWLISTCSWTERSNQRERLPNLEELINAEGVEGTTFTIIPLLKKLTIPNHNPWLAEKSTLSQLSLAFAICRHTKQSNSAVWETHSENLCTWQAGGHSQEEEEPRSWDQHQDASLVFEYTTHYSWKEGCQWLLYWRTSGLLILNCSSP